MGFEALLAGIETYVYGNPFYSGWGLTIDRGNKSLLSRRKSHRTLEELFHAAYIVYSRYYHPLRKAECDIEDIIEFIIYERTQYLTHPVDA